MPSINHLVIPNILLEGLVIILGITRLLMLGIEDNESTIFVIPDYFEGMCLKK